MNERQHEVDGDWGNSEPSANWRPGQRRRERKSVEHTISGAKYMMRSAARRDTFDLPHLALLAALADEHAEALDMAVENLRARGHSWAEIGRAMGMTKQGVFRRFHERVAS